MLIARIWRGHTEAATADEYVEYMRDTGVRDLAATPGNQGVLMLRRPDGDRVEFTVMSLWSSLQDIEAFAGEDIERARFYPRDEEFLVARELTCTHAEVPVRVAG